MLSRLKGSTSRTRTGSESSTELLGAGNSPTKTRNDRDSLSPDRARTSRSRSSSVTQSIPPSSSNGIATESATNAIKLKRRSANYSMPESNSSRYSLGVGQGTLTFDQIPSGTHSDSNESNSIENDYDSPKNSPNKVNAFPHSNSNLALEQVDEDPLLTPTPSSSNQHPPFDSVIAPSPSLTVIQPLRGRSASSASARPSLFRSPSPARMVSLPIPPPDQQNGLAALAKINTATPPPPITTTTNSRQLSRSASVTSDSRNYNGRPSQEINSASSSRKSTLLSPESIVSNGSTASVNGKSSSPLKKIKSSSAIAAAMIAAGVNLSPPSARNQPLPLSRVTTRGSETGSSLDDYFGSERNGLLSALDIESDFDDAMSQLGTGYAVASSKRNAEFHSLFRNISEDDYLIEGASIPLSVDEFD